MVSRSVVEYPWDDLTLAKVDTRRLERQASPRRMARQEDPRRARVGQRPADQRVVRTCVPRRRGLRPPGLSGLWRRRGPQRSIWGRPSIPSVCEAPRRGSRWSSQPSPSRPPNGVSSAPGSPMTSQIQYTRTLATCAAVAQIGRRSGDGLIDRNFGDMFAITSRNRVWYCGHMSQAERIEEGLMPAWCPRSRPGGNARELRVWPKVQGAHHHGWLPRRNSHHVILGRRAEGVEQLTFLVPSSAAASAARGLSRRGGTRELRPPLAKASPHGRRRRCRSRSPGGR